MANPELKNSSNEITNMTEFAQCADYSLMYDLNPDPEATDTGDDHDPRQVFSGHYVPVKPTPIANPEYIAHSHSLFAELGLDESLAHKDDFRRFFSGDLSQVTPPIKPIGWATGYALSIYGTEYIQQCPFQTGNGYGDGRAMSVFEGVFNGKRWEMRLKGGGRTPYCRGGDGRAVLRSSIREFLAQEHMHALGIPTSRSLSLFVSHTEHVNRPWYSEDSNSFDPDMMTSNPVAISTRVAPSFLRVGQLELFGRRARSHAHENAQQELKMIVLHAIEREYKEEVNSELPLEEKVIQFALAFRDRLTDLVTHWLRVGYCQGNFNSDNCAVGGYTLDYGPFGFCEQFDPFFQPWTGGGRHFSFMNQPAAARANYEMFCVALQPLLTSHPEAQSQLDTIRTEFPEFMQKKVERMWADKLGLHSFNEDLVTRLLRLMVETSVDYTLFFRELSQVPVDMSALETSFYGKPSVSLSQKWAQWIADWRGQLSDSDDFASVSNKMKAVNPKYTWREWLVVPAYQRAMNGNYALVGELQEILTRPYAEQSEDIENRYYQRKPQEYFQAGGVSHYSCSS